MLGTILELQGQTDQAKERYNRALKIDPRAAVAANNLAWFDANTNGNLDVALQLAQTAKAQLPNRHEVDDTLGWIYYKKGLSSLAVESLSQSTNRQPDNPNYNYHLALAYHQNGDKEKARTNLEKALKSRQLRRRRRGPQAAGVDQRMSAAPPAPGLAADLKEIVTRAVRVPRAALPDDAARPAAALQAGRDGFRVGDLHAPREHGGVLGDLHARGAARHRHAVPALRLLRPAGVELLGLVVPLRGDLADRERQPRDQGVLSAGDLSDLGGAGLARRFRRSARWCWSA